MICVVGIGNPLRSDDGIGPYVANQIEVKNLKDVKVLIIQQLHVELLEELMAYEKVILVDACVAGKDIDFYPLEQANNRVISSSHHLDAQLFSTLAKRLYGKEINLHICSIRAEVFSIGERLSERVMTCAQKAIELICSSIQGEVHA